MARFPNGPFELDDMQEDPRGRFNRYGRPGTEAIRADLAQRLDAFFDHYADPEDNVWKGGGSQAKRPTE
jgi:hypothetical protein